uniref:HMA domain-containing protein n=1 Tax=Leersia perrieri TaxID=77586 RepID=A0A0D9VAY8_9ORYZ
MASLVFKDLNKRLLGLSCSSGASTSIVVSGGRAIDRHSPPHLRDPARSSSYAATTTTRSNSVGSSSSKKTKTKTKQRSEQQLVSPASSSRFLLNSSRMQPADESSLVRPVVAEEQERENDDIVAAAAASDSPAPPRQQVVVELRVSLHCKGCAGKVKKHISKMEGVTSLHIDIATKKVTVVGDITPLAVLSTVSKIKPAQFWPPAISDINMIMTPPRASASF